MVEEALAMYRAGRPLFSVATELHTGTQRLRAEIIEKIGIAEYKSLKQPPGTKKGSVKESSKPVYEPTGNEIELFMQSQPHEVIYECQACGGEQDAPGDCTKCTGGTVIQTKRLLQEAL